MDVLVYHSELQQAEFPDCCVRCGANNTKLTPVVLSDTAVSQYTTVTLPFCSAHEKAPLISLNYPKLREFNSEGIIIANAAVQFAEALEAFRRTHPPDLSVRVPLPHDSAASPEAEQAYRRFAIGALVAAVLLGFAIAGIVLLFRSAEHQPAVDAPNDKVVPNPHRLE